jgi:SAM-dependent methyltransferase
LSRLTFNPAVRTLLNSADLVPNLLFRDYRRLPPNHLRVRVGVGNEVFNNQPRYFATFRFWLFAFHEGWCKLDSTIVDIGVGCGRYAHILRDFDFQGRRFTGRYIGIDIDEEALDWCRRHFDEQRFSFHLSTDRSSSYNKDHGGEQRYRVPVADGATDLVFSTSLFTHLLEGEVENYLAESARLLRPGGVAAHSVFCLDYPPPTFGNRHTFQHQLGNARVESLKQPEAAVAYSEAYLTDLARRVGFAEAEILHGQGAWQPVLLARR